MLRHQVWLFTLSMMTASGWAANNSVPAALPEPVLSALSQASIPSDAVSVWVARTRAPQTRFISHNAQRPMQAASVIKLVTTYAALDMLGPQFAWRTPVWLDGVIDGEVLKGNLVIQGQGDPSLVLERFWLLLRRVQSMGVRRIDGDVILDGSAFSIQRQDPGAFDGEPLRPYNAAPEALLINFRALTLTFTPDTQAGVARVQMDPPLWGVEVPKAVALTNSPKTACGDYRSALQADFSNPERIGLRGTYDAACGEKIWPVAYAQPETYNARAIEGLWRSMGGDLRGVVRDGTAPKRKPSFVMTSPSLGEVIRDINKFSNNVMAQQLFLTLGRWPPPPRGKSLNTQAAQGNDTDMPNWPSATFERSRERIREWWGARIGTASVPEIDNGSGLSRRSQLQAQALGDMLQKVHQSPYLAELMASLPIAGVDGTLRRYPDGRVKAHLKTGSLRGVVSLAGYVHTSQGENVVLVAVVNHERAQAARPALEALVQWVAEQPSK